MMASAQPTGGSVLLYDGDCGFCNRAVQFVLRHDSRRTLRFAPLASAFGRAVLRQRPDLAGVDSMVWVDLDDTGAPRDVRVRSAAALQIGHYLGGGWDMGATAAHAVPRRLRDAAYAWVARHRRRLAREPACLVLTTEERQRFLDAT